MPNLVIRVAVDIIRPRGNTMKKILLASTALAAFAGAAAADVRVTGSAEMGVVGATFDVESTSGFDDSTTEPLQFFNDGDVQFRMSGETDGGVAFGATLDLDEAGKLGNTLGDQDFDIFISSDFGRVTLGDTDGAVSAILDGAVDVGSPGSINDAETAHAGYLGDWLDGSGDGQILRYNYDFDAFSFAGSIEMHPSGGGGRVVEDDDDLTWGLAAGYGFEFGGGSANVGIGYQFSNDPDITIGFADESTFGGDVNGDGDTDDDVEIDFGADAGDTSVIAIGGTVDLDAGFGVGLTYSLYQFDELDDDLTHIGVGAGYAFDAISLHANYGLYTFDDATSSGFGLAAGYDLGGGASLLASYGSSTAETLPVDGEEVDVTSSTYSIGLSFSF